MRALLVIFLVIAFAAFGGIFQKQIRKDTGNSAFTTNNRVHSYFFDQHRKWLMDMGMYGGQPIHDFMSGDEKIRLQLATYTNDVNEREKGLPVLALYNSMGSIKGFFRLDGQNQSPLFLLKTNADSNKVIMGLDLSSDEDPFLFYIDKHGIGHNLFGHFHF